MSDKGTHVGGYLLPGRDDDLIDKWNSLSKGERSEVFREALEQYFQMPPSKRRNPLSRLADDIGRAIKLLEEMRGLIKDLSTRPVMVGHQPPAVDAEVDQAAVVRNENMKKNLW